MNIIVKELDSENHIYLMDVNMRPCSVDVVDKDKTNEFVKDMVKKYVIENISVTSEIDNSKSDDYFTDNI